MAIICHLKSQEKLRKRLALLTSTKKEQTTTHVHTYPDTKSRFGILDWETRKSDAISCRDQRVRKKSFKMQWRETSIITYSVYIGRSIPYCSTRKSCQGKNWGVAGEAAAKNRWTLPLKICIYPGMKKGCLCVAVGMPWTTRCICYAYIHSVKLTPSLQTNISEWVLSNWPDFKMVLETTNQTMEYKKYGETRYSIS